jgi:hypothetical protein
MEESAQDTPLDPRTPREKALEEKLGARTILVALLSIIAVVEALVIVRLAF